LEVRYNSEWLAALDMPEILELTSTATVAQLLERGDFAKRFEANSPISVMEFMYPLLQGYDSVAVQADVELGGSDQLWNLMMGRAIQERYGQRAQVAMTMPLLIGTDGSQKMSQSLGNYIGVTEPAEEIFGKTMSIPDRLMPQWFELATELPADEVQRVLSGVGDETIHPRAAKELLAKSITELYRGPVEAERAAADFQRVFSNRDVPDRIETFPLPPEDPVALPQFFREAGVVKSAAEARRLLAQGAIEVNGATMTADQIPRNELAGSLVKVGKRRFLRVGGIEPTL
jgi:tyrosyl-tRNA synthetase